MADYNKINVWANNATHQGRVNVALHVTAMGIVNESGSTQNHTKRLAWADHMRATGQPGMNIAQILLLVLSDTLAVLDHVADDMAVADENAYAAAVQGAVDSVVEAELIKRFG